MNFIEYGAQDIYLPEDCADIKVKPNIKAIRRFRRLCRNRTEGAGVTATQVRNILKHESQVNYALYLKIALKHNRHDIARLILTLRGVKLDPYDSLSHLFLIQNSKNLSSDLNADVIANICEVPRNIQSQAIEFFKKTIDNWSDNTYTQALENAVYSDNTKIITYLISVRKCPEDIVFTVENIKSIETFRLVNKYIKVSQYNNINVLGDEEYLLLNKLQPSINPEQCSVCLLNNTQLTTPCMHQFCITCYRKWSLQSNLCPLCRTPMCGKE